MLVSEWLTQVRGYLDDAAKAKYPDALIVSNGDAEARAMLRKLSRADDSYQNFTLWLRASAATQVFDSAWRWKLPTWVHRVTSVYERDASTDTTTATLSPHRFVNSTGVRLLEEITKTSQQRNDGWSWESGYTIMLHGWKSAPDLAVRVARQPPRMFQGRVMQAEASAKNSFLLPSSPTLGAIDNEGGAYIGAEFAVTATKIITSTNLGEVRRCIDSSPTQIVSGARVHRIWVESDYPEIVAVDDMVETIVPVNEAFNLYHVLRTVQATLSKKANIDLLRVISPRLAAEEQDFMLESAPQRDTRGPFFYNERSSNRQRIDREVNGSYYGS